MRNNYGWNEKIYRKGVVTCVGGLCSHFSHNRCTVLYARNRNTHRSSWRERHAKSEDNHQQSTIQASTDYIYHKNYKHCSNWLRSCSIIYLFIHSFIHFYSGSQVHRNYWKTDIGYVEYRAVTAINDDIAYNLLFYDIFHGTNRLQ